jgi:hypothetical protein
MGNKPSRDDNSSVSSTPISLISSADGNFGLGGTWKCNALLAVLETLFRVPCLCECILGAQIDQKCKSSEQKAIYELQLLFDARANASKGSLVAADQFLFTLLETQPTSNREIFDQNDPSDLYNAISQLIVSSLPELRGIFYDRNDNKLSNRKEKDVQIKSMKSNGISINLIPDYETELENEIESERLPRPKILETTPIFVVNTKYLDDGGRQKSKFPLSCYSLSFPTSLNLGKLTPSTAEMERSDLIYHLHGVIAEVQGTDGSRTIKSFSRSSPDLNAWCESANKPRPTNLLEIQDLGVGLYSCVRVLIYIQSDLSLMTSSHLPIAGTKIFKEASTNPKLNSANGIPIFQQITGLSGSLSPSHSTVNSNINRGGMMKGSTLKTISQGFCTPLGVGAGPGADEGGQPMEEELEDDDEDDDDDEEDDDDYEYESDGDEEDYDSDSYESPEYEDETPAECQCPTCRRERDQKLRDLARLKSEKELLEQVKREKLRRLMTPKTPGNNGYFAYR